MPGSSIAINGRSSDLCHLNAEEAAGGAAASSVLH